MTCSSYCWTLNTCSWKKLFSKTYLKEWSDYLKILKMINNCKKLMIKLKNTEEATQSIGSKINNWIKINTGLSYQEKENITDEMKEITKSCENLRELIEELSKSKNFIKKHTETINKIFDYVYMMIDNLRDVTACEKYRRKQITDSLS